MKGTVVFVFVAFCAVSALSSLVDEKKSKPSVTVTPASEFGGTSAVPSNATTLAPNATTLAPNATTLAPNATTLAPNATTLAPNATTLAPNTTTHVPTTTTHVPTTTTHAPTTAKPTPPTDLTVGNYTLKTDKNVICLMAQMALQIRLATTQLNGTFIVQPHLTNTQGSCQENTANFTLAFKEGFITFMFNQSTADNSVYVDALSFSLSYPFSTGENAVYSANNKSMNLFAATIGHAYSCKAESLYMGNGLYLDVNQDRMQAFNLKNDDFGPSDPCPADRPDYRVAIGVGVTLLVLIVIVVIAYLLGRKRRTDGYQSL